MDNRMKILRDSGVSGAAVGLVGDLSSVQNKWLNVEYALQGHKRMIAKRVASLTQDVEAHIANLTARAEKFAADWEKKKPKHADVKNSATAAAAVETMKKLRANFSELREEAGNVVAECAQFHMPVTSIPAVDTLANEMDEHEESWLLYRGFVEKKAEMGQKPWTEFRANIGVFEDFIADWEDAILKQCKKRGPNPICDFLRQELNQLRESVILLKLVRGEAFTSEHWKTLFMMLELGVANVNELKFDHFLSVIDKLVANADQIKELQQRAQGEVSIRDAIEELKTWSANTEFSIFDHEEGGRITPLIRDWKELLTTIGDNQALLASLKDSQFFKPFEDQVHQWEVTLSTLDQHVHSLNVVQRKWLYLEPIFARGQLPQEEVRFKSINSKFVDIVTELSNNPKVLQLVAIPGIGETLSMLQEQLERCQHALSDFLEEKRSKFPRFYFLGDDDLLEILGQARNPLVIQTHLKKLFQGIHSVEFSADKQQVVAMKSAAEEVVILEKSVTVTDFVEDWLADLANQMKATLLALLVRCLKDFDVKLFPAQILSLTESIMFTHKCTAAINEKSRQFAVIKDELAAKLSTYTLMDPGDDHVLPLKLKYLVFDVIHHRDIADVLAEAKSCTLNDWVWKKQLRFYYDKHASHCYAMMGEGAYDYSFEYQGNAAKLVYTPLTDKCFLTLTQGIFRGFGGNPYGPAGTGKTESVKALGQYLGRQVVVFNCGEGIDVKSMGRMFMGLVKCGAWGCFDEFNRLDEDVLSAVSQLIQIIQGALKAHGVLRQSSDGAADTKPPQIKLLDKDVYVDPSSGIFVTMNPAGKGYGGRSRLPDNLKQLFRPVAMSVPDMNLIAEVILLSEGFSYARELGHKLVSVFRLCKHLLSYQQHYDWGLRALKSILGMGGAQVQEVKKAEREHQFKSVEGNIFVVDKFVEQSILVKALRTNTLSKLVRADVQRFNLLLGDVFNLEQEKELPNEAKNLLANISKRFVKQNMIPNDKQINKMQQLYENINQRMGVVIVGPSGCGKTTMWSILSTAWQETYGCTIHIHSMNPKAIPRQQLLGYLDPDTREWTDGILTSACRQVSKEPSNVRSWIICDGDVDPEWIESLNSVLDDNRLLTLPNGERIQFGSNVNFLFETDNLKYASPATISRMGMIFLSDDDIDIKAIVMTWVKEQPADLQAQLSEWVDKFFYGAVELLRSGSFSFVVDTTLVGLVKNGLSHLVGVKHKMEFALGLIRGLGGNLSNDRRTAFGCEVFKWVGESPLDKSRPWDCFVDPASGKLMSYKSVPAMELTHDTVLVEPMVPTVEALSSCDLLMPALRNMDPIIVVGPEGCGKTTLLRHCFSQLKSTSVATLHCSSQTSSIHLLQKLDAHCLVQNAATGRVYRPKDTERLILFLKDINLPKPDKYDTMQLISFLQQLITYNVFYDENCEKLSLERIQIVCSMTPTTVGRFPLTTRFTAITRIFAFSLPEKSQLQQVCYSYLKPVVCTFESDPTWKQPSNVAKLANTMVNIFDEIRKRFTLDAHVHYLFTPRDVIQWVLGLMHYDPHCCTFFEAWKYEGNKIFRDKLVGETHQAAFDSIVSKAAKADWGQQADVDLRGQFFTTWGKVSTTNEDKALLGKVSKKELQPIIARGIILYQREVKDLNITLFAEIVDHFARVNRVLSREGGSLLLVGKSGVGRSTAIAVTAHLNRLHIFTPNITRTYNKKSFYNDLKEVLHAATVDNESVLLLLEDHQLVEEEFVEAINSLLSGGEIPGLYSPEELEGVLSALKGQCADEGFFGSVAQFFAARVRRRLHVTLIMDSDSNDFARRCQSNPALLTKCSVQWWDQWGNEGVKALPIILLKPVFGDVKRAGTVCDKIMQTHKSMEQYGIASPRRYCSFIKTYKKIYTSKWEQLQKEKQSLTAGLTKLGEAAATVDSLSREALVKSDQLQKSKAKANAMMKTIEEKMQVAASEREEMKHLSASLVADKEATTKQKTEVERQLGKIQPILDAACKAVGNISRRNIDDMRILRTPSQTIVDIMEGVVLLMGGADTSWNAIRVFLGKPTVLSEISSFDPGNITAERRALVEKHRNERAHSFDPINAKHASVGALPLAEWVSAVLEYSQVKLSIAPLEEKLAKANAKLQAAEKKIAELQKNLEELNNDIEALKKQYEDTTAEAMRSQIDLAETEKVLVSAQNLLKKLSVEHTRWGARGAELDAQLSQLPVGCVLASAFVTYLGHACEDVRAEVVQKWKQIGEVSEWSFLKFMSTETELVTMRKRGLPADDLSSENALIIKWTLEVPFIVDPSSTSSQWLTNTMSEAPTIATTVPPTSASTRMTSSMRMTSVREVNRGKAIECVTQDNPKFVTKLELAVRFGKTLIIKEVDRIHPILFPLLRRDLVKQGPQLTVQIGDKAVSYCDTFRLFLMTRDPHPDLTPDARALVCEVNFTVTRAGLESALLGVALTVEKPQLEAEKMKALMQEEKNKLEMITLENQLLEDLGRATGNILENKELQDSLNETKRKSEEIAAALKTSKATQEELDKERNVYAPIAKTGSVLFFVLTDLAKINHMYQFSLSSFLPIFRRSLLSTADVAAAVARRVQSAVEALEQSVFEHISRSLFKADRLMFAMHLVHVVKPAFFKPKQWEMFTGQLAAGSSLAAAGQPVPAAQQSGAVIASLSQTKAFPAWAPKDRAAAYADLEAQLPQLVAAFSFGQNDAWSTWLNHPECETDFPKHAMSSCTAFERLILLKVFRPDRLESGMFSFCTEALHLSSLSPSALNLHRVHLENSPSVTSSQQQLASGGGSEAVAPHAELCDRAEPVLLITTPGADPSQELVDVAEKIAKPGHFTEIAMGQGQQETALEIVRQAMQSGDWVILKNLHLAVSWLSVLEKQLTASEPHPNFRIWLTSEPHPKFSTILLQSSLKITYEAPPGLKKNLERTYESWSAEFVEKGNDVFRAQSLFVLAWFHAVVQERRKFIPQGWTKFYEFNEADLRAAADIIDKIHSSQTIDWTTVHGLLENAVYGGRVDNTFDFQVLQQYLRTYFNSDVLNTVSSTKRPLAPKIELPRRASYVDYKKLIAELPSADAPLLFGLPLNIDRSLQRTNSMRVLQQLKVAAAPADASLRLSEWKEQLSPIIDMWKQMIQDNRDLLLPLASGSSGSSGGGATGDDPSLQPVDAFVHMEAMSGRSLLAFVDAAMSSLHEFLMGRLLMSAEMQHVGACLIKGQVPPQWDARWEGPDNHTAWMRLLVRKNVALNDWLRRCKDKTLLTKPLNLNDLFRPATFLDALRQQCARTARRPLDSLKLSAVWLSAGTRLTGASTAAASAASGPSATVDGLLLQGCGFDNGKLADAYATAPELIQAPRCIITWIPEESPSPYDDASVLTVDVAVYQNILREKLVTVLSMPCSAAKEKWSVAGVALFLSEE
eukprot:TRINITY_DN578_c0_g1_i21.p1 TRINITY_DN578_c0_g1~~TRINITY_DN578_c0_g1_i21.p1  ORF type:complete len:3400 (+),score=883.23 TRINITY_DN578_c0_g1_i21:3362-13561(+)